MLMKSPDINVEEANFLIEKWLDSYFKNKKTIRLDFREDVSWIRYGERLTHNIHPYPAKLLPHIPAVFLQNSILSKRNSIILDPFCGSGTVGVEALLASKNFIGIDANPLACLIAKTKLSKISERSVKRSLDKIKSRFSTVEVDDFPDVVNVDYWFYPHVKLQLSKLIFCINEEKITANKNFLKVCYSSLIKKVSLADLNIAVPVRLKADKYPDSSVHKQKALERLKKLKRVNLIQLFEGVVCENIKKINSIDELNYKNNSKLIVQANSSKKIEYIDKVNSYLSENNRKSVDMIISSPPYAGAQKYIRSSSLNLGWLGLSSSSNLKAHEQKSIGRESFLKNEYQEIIRTNVKSANRIIEKIFKNNPLRACIVSTYINEMEKVICNAKEILKPGGYFVLIIGDNMVCNNEFYTHKYITQLFCEQNFSLVLKGKDAIKSRGLMTKRNKTSGMISHEWVLVFQK